MPPSTAPTRRPARRRRRPTRREESEPDHVREPRRPAVLERPFAEPRLEHLVVEDAREAPASAEHEPERELQCEQRQQHPPAGQHGDERDDADDCLVHARRPRVDHLRVVVGVRSPLHSGKYLPAVARPAPTTIPGPVARYAPAALVAALLVATGFAFLHTESLKLETSPIRQTRVTKLFSPVCRCDYEQGADRVPAGEARRRQRLDRRRRRAATCGSSRRAAGARARRVPLERTRRRRVRSSATAPTVPVCAST